MNGHPCQNRDATNAGCRMLRPALAYAARGCPVFPCRVDKKPATAHGFKDATTDPEQVRRWWTEQPAALIGAPTGTASGRVVVDLDTDTDKGLDGPGMWAALLKLHNAEVTTRTHRTPRGGLHLVFTHPGEKVKSTTSTLAPGIDTRGDGGYIILPPSQNGAAPYTVELDIDPSPLPAWLIALFREKGIMAAQKAKSTPTQETMVTNDHPGAAKVRDALNHVPADCPFDTWLSIGMALHDWNPSDGLRLWDQWSQTAPERYDAAAIALHAKTFKPGGGVTIASLFKLATDNGWNPVGAANEYGPALIGDHGKHTINQAHFAARYAADSGIVHDPSVSRFYVYHPATGLWTHQTDEATVRELGLCFQRIVTEEGCLNLLAKRSSSILHGLRELTRGIAERRDVFGQRRDAIHVANGMLVLANNGNVDLRPFSPDWYSRNRSEIAWNPEADCPRFKAELLLSAMDAEDASLIQRYVGQCLLGVNVSQTFLVLRGTPGGGKSTLANVLEGLIGRHNVTELRVAHLTERFELIRFVGRTLLSGKDVPGDFLNMRPAHVLKALVGGDTLEGEVKNGNESFSIEGRFNVLISTNTRLRVKLDSDAGAWKRRMLIVDYARPPVEKPIDRFEDVLLQDEGPGILRWAVDGAIQLLQEMDQIGRMILTEAQRRRVDDLLSESDSVRSFVRDCIESAHGAEVTIHDLTAAYRDYCEARDWDPLRDRQFQSELPDAMLEYHRAPRRNDIRQDGKSVRGFRGVRLQTTSERASEPSEPCPELPFSDASDASPNTIAHTRGSISEQNRGEGLYYAKSLAQPSDPSETVSDAEIDFSTFDFEEGEL